ncbi:MAG: major capsid protein E [Caudoviricetes sp.]|nr:MAG: major capsid protein E [Caudoviricetes sp.]
MDLRKFFTPAAIAANWTEVASNQIPYMGTGLFPARKKAGLDLSWLKGSKGLPVSLMPSAFDAKATFRDRIGFEKLETEMPFFREGFKIKEKDRQELLRVQDSNDPYARTMIDRVFDDANNLIDGANVVPERMIFQLLFPVDGNAGISIVANGVDYTYSYDRDGAWKAQNYIALTGGDLWTAPATADPFKAFKAAKDGVRSRTGTELTTAIMNTATFNLLAATDAVKNRYLTTNGLSLGYLTDDEVKAVVSGTSRIQIAIYDKMFKDENGVAHAFVPDGYVCLIPTGSLGNTWYGTTPEEADLMSDSQAEVSIVNTGVAITRIIDAHPVNINTIASEIVLPSYERMDEVTVLKVA